MDFKLNDEQEEFRKLARDFGTRELAPAAEHCDKEPGKAASFYQKIFEAGLMNVQLPDCLGGLGLGLRDASLIAEGLSQGCSGISAAIEYSALAQLPLLIAGSPAQQEEFLCKLNEELSFGAIGLESLFGEKCAVECKKNGAGYVLSGQVTQVLNAAIADWFVIDAVDPVDDSRMTFLIRKDAANLKVGEKLFTVGRKAATINMVHLDGVEVPGSACLLKADADAISARVDIASAARILIAAGMIGVAQSAFEHAKRYANERQTFGKPIAQHQGIAFMMADMAKDIEAARELTWQAGILTDKGSGASEAATSALLFASEMAMRVTTDAVQVYGGYGYSKEYPVEKLMRDAKTYQCMIPSSHMLKAALGRQLLSV